MGLSWPGGSNTAARRPAHPVAATATAPAPAAAVETPPVLHVSGVVPFSSSDWPGRLVAVVFVQGCPWRCSYCYNPELQARRGDHVDSNAPGRAGRDDVAHQLAWQAVLQMLERRVGLLDGVVFSGGEPTLDPGLPAAITQVRALGYGVGLHSAGIAAEHFAALLPLVDWVRLDVKTHFADYAGVTGVPRSGRAPRRCLELLLDSGMAHELRTTYHPALQDDASLLALAQELRTMGARRWVLQQWREHERQADDNGGHRRSSSNAPNSCSSSPLAACWRWPDEAVLRALRRAVPELLLR
ncbi:MAG: hypothetical protein RIQ60_290 [Pseudomonadota bacterium]|jgi:pyruvate formate lyase activating enzyme